jgi:hypothetical protein
MAGPDPSGNLERPDILRSICDQLSASWMSSIPSLWWPSPHFFLPSRPDHLEERSLWEWRSSGWQRLFSDMKQKIQTDQDHKKRIQERPGKAQNGALVLYLKVADGENLDQLPIFEDPHPNASFS